MFPIAHAYLLERLVAERGAADYLGCVWPDMLFSGPLTHAQTHRQGRELLAFALGEGPVFQTFVRAALTHMAEPHGFDWYSDEQYDPGAAKGYAFERARPFVDDVVRAARVEPAIGLWKAHNFVEMSFEQALGRRYPHLGRAVGAACADRELAALVTEPLARFFNQPQAALARNISAFPNTVALASPTSWDLAAAYSWQLRAKHGVETADIPAMAAIIDRVWVAIAPDRERFLDDCVARVADMLAR